VDAYWRPEISSTKDSILRILGAKRVSPGLHAMRFFRKKPALLLGSTNTVFSVFVFQSGKLSRRDSRKVFMPKNKKAPAVLPGLHMDY
jgi:hypothetical protein